MAINLNLTKEESLIQLDMRKKQILDICMDKRSLDGLVSRVALVLDFSASMRAMYDNGVVQATIERLLPVAMQFDDNGEMELWIFSSDYHRMPNVSIKNFYGYVEREIMNGRYTMRGTNYAPVMRDIRKKYVVEDPANIPNYVIFITDGDALDEDSAIAAIKDLSYDPIFFQFVGIAEDRSVRFRLLSSLDDMDGRYVDNANFFKMSDATEGNDNEIYKKLLAEYPEWVEYPEVKRMIAIQGTKEAMGTSRSNDKKKGLFSRLFS